VRRRRFVVGRDITILHETAVEVEIESVLRLRPGSVIDVCDHRTRVAHVGAWMVARLGKDGPVYRGVCRWDAPTG
jgi:hypothetical protein